MKRNRFCVLAAAVVAFGMLTAQSALAGACILPDQLRTIDEEAFMGDNQITFVSVPDTVTVIKDRAFSNSGLTRVFLPGSVNTISGSAFDGCGEIEIFAEDETSVYTAVERMSPKGSTITLRRMYTISENENAAKLIDSGDRIAFAFTAKERAVYSFHDMGIAGSRAVLMDERGNVLVEDDNSYNGYGFLINRSMAAGERVYLIVSLDGDSEDWVYVSAEKGTGRAVEQVSFGGNTVNVAAGTTIRTMFEAPMRGKYRFTAEGVNAVNAAIYDYSGSEIDSGTNCDPFTTLYSMDEGEAIYLDAGYTSSSAAGALNVDIEYVCSGLGVGSNVLTADRYQTCGASFTAPEDGWYTMRSEDAGSSTAKLFSKAGIQLGTSAAASDGGFILNREMQKGETVYLTMQFSSGSSSRTKHVAVEYDSGALDVGTNRVFLNAGEKVTRAFTASGTDKYTFTVASDQVSSIALYNAAGRKIATDSGAAGRAFSVTYRVQAGETVRLEVNGAASGTVGMIEIVVEENTAKFREGENSVELGTGENVSCNFTALSTGEYRFMFETEADAYAVITSSGAEEERVESEDEDHDFYYSCTMSKGDVLSIKLGFKAASDSGTVIVTVEKVIPELISGDNELYADAGMSASGNFTAFAAGRYVFSSIGSAAMYGRILDVDGTEMCSATGTAQSPSYELTVDMSRNETVRLETGFVSASGFGAFGVRVQRRILTGDNSVYLKAGETLEAEFIVPKTAKYTFRSTGSMDTQAELYNSNGQKLSSGDDEDGKNFVIEQQLTQGQKVILKISLFNPIAFGTFNVNIS